MHDEKTLADEERQSTRPNGPGPMGGPAASIRRARLRLKLELQRERAVEQHARLRYRLETRLKPKERAKVERRLKRVASELEFLGAALKPPAPAEPEKKPRAARKPRATSTT